MSPQQAKTPDMPARQTNTLASKSKCPASITTATTTVQTQEKDAVAKLANDTTDSPNGGLERKVSGKRKRRNEEGHDDHQAGPEHHATNDDINNDSLPQEEKVHKKLRIRKNETLRVSSQKSLIYTQAQQELDENAAAAARKEAQQTAQENTAAGGSTASPKQGPASSGSGRGRFGPFKKLNARRRRHAWREDWTLKDRQPLHCTGPRCREHPDTAWVHRWCWVCTNKHCGMEVCNQCKDRIEEEYPAVATQDRCRG